jgi:hypothetical protein
MRFPTKTEFFAALGVTALAVFFIGRGCQKRHDIATLSPNLRPGVREKIIVNPKHHSLIVITRTETKASTLPDRPSSIEFMDNGKVKVNSPQFGTEFSPFFGVAYALRGGIVGGGLDVLYWKKLDLSFGFGTNPSLIQDASLFVGVSYFVYSNTSLMLGMDNRQSPILMLKVRL